MPKGKCDVSATSDSVDVESDGLFGTRTSRIWFGCFVIFLFVYSSYFSAFHSGRGPSLVEAFRGLHPGSRGFVIHLIGLAYGSLVELFVLAIGIRHLLRFGERLHADRSALTWSRIPWLSLGNRWVTRSVPLSEIVQASYGIVYKSKNVHGILIETWSEQWKSFWGIESPESNRILRGLKGLGVNVHRDPEMRESIRETLRDRRAQL